MDEGIPHIDVRAVHVDDALALHRLDSSFETDRIYTLHVQNRLLRGDANRDDPSTFAFELIETPVEPPLYKNHGSTLPEVEAKLQHIEGGYVALADGEIAGGIFLNIEEWRSVTRVEEIIVGHQFRRYGVGTLLLHCASDWARKRGCWAIVLETQNTNYPAVQFYLRNGMSLWSIQQHFYPPGLYAHEIAIMMGKQLAATSPLISDPEVSERRFNLPGSL